MISIFRYLLPTRTFFLLVVYMVLLIASLFLAYQLRFDFRVPSDWQAMYWENVTWIIPLKLVLLFSFGQFGGLLSYFRLPDVYRVFSALFLTAVFLLYVYYITDGRDCPPRGVILVDFVLSLIFLCGFRTGLRILREYNSAERKTKGKRAKRVAVVGAGDVGATIASDLLSRKGLGMKPIVFLDDDSKKWKKHIHGIVVVDSPDNLEAVQKKFGIDSIIIAMPSASGKRVREIIQLSQKLGIDSEIVPSLAEITSGRVRASRVRPVQIEDLLGREAVELDSENIEGLIENKVVLVTGAGGSIGSELCRQIAENNPKRLLLVEQSEVQLFQIEQQLIEEGYGAVITPLVADVLDQQRIDHLLGLYKPTLIFHAAAHKHVFMMERQPSEAIKNNSFGTRCLAELAIKHEVERFVLISTDKAINPTNVMGASKRLAEIFIQSRQQGEDVKTRFMAVRFGNVLGSSGSVIPIFRKQIAQGGPVKVTHPEVTRYFMTIPEAVGLVLQCATQGTGGEIFVLDMGDPIKIVDLARQMIELSGYRPNIDIDIEFIGLRAGEKLFEELQHQGESFAETKHPRIMRFICQPLPYEDVSRFYKELEEGLNQMERNDIKRRIQSFVPEYTPFLD